MTPEETKAKTVTVTFTQQEVDEIFATMNEVTGYFKCTRRFNDDTDIAHAHNSARLAGCILNAHLAEREDDRKVDADMADGFRELLELSPDEFWKYAKNDHTPAEVREEIAHWRKDYHKLRQTPGWKIPYEYGLFLVAYYEGEDAVPEDCKEDRARQIAEDKKWESKRNG